MFKKSLIIVGITAAVSMAFACSGPDTLSQRNWGKSYGTAVYSQTLNPDAGKTSEPVESLDGQAAKNNMQKYQDGFKVKETIQTGGLILK